jgi:LPS-assembly lipoprotein
MSSSITPYLKSAAKMSRKVILLFFCAYVLSLSGCGFQLRGAGGLHLKSVYVKSESADRISNEIKQLLTEEQVALAASEKEAQVILQLQHEAFDRRTVTVSAGQERIEEIELNYHVNVELQKADATPLIKKRQIHLVRDYSFDNTAMLAMDTEEQTLREDLFQDMAMQIMRMLRVVQVAE